MLLPDQTKKDFWKIGKRKLSELKPHPQNPRKLIADKYADLKKSIEENGDFGNLIVDADNTILSGNMRLRAFIDLYGKDHEVDVKYPSRQLTKEEQDFVLLKANISSGIFDFDMLANNFNIEFLIAVGMSEKDLKTDYEKDFEKIDNTRAEMPIVPKYLEKYSAILIISETEMDENFIKTRLNLDTAKSYKSTAVGKSYVMTMAQFQDIWKKSQ